MQNPRLDLAAALGRYGDIDASVYTQQIDRVGVRRVDIFAHLTIATAGVTSLWRLYPVWAPILWLAALGLSLLYRVSVQRRYRAAPFERRADRSWTLWFALGALATGCVWGLLASAFVVTNDLMPQMLALTLIGAMSIAGIARNAASTPVMVGLVAPMITMSAGALLVHPTSFHVAVSIMFAALAVVVITSGRTLHQSLNADLRKTLELVKTGTTLANAQDAANVGGWEVEAATRRVVWSGAMFRILGLEASSRPPSIEMILEKVHPEDRDRVAAAIDDWLLGATDLAIDHRLVGNDGDVRWIHQFGLTHQDMDGRPARHVAMVQDITEKKRAEEKLEFANVVLRTQMEAAQSGVMVVSKTGEIITFNERFLELTKCPRSLLEAGRYDAVLGHLLSHVRDADAYRRRVQYFNDNPEENGSDDIEIVGHRSIHQYTVTLKGPSGDYLGRVWFLRDETEHRQALAEAVMISRLDPLTGLANRGAFVEALQLAVVKAARGDATFAVLYIDLDHFKDVNDGLGHPAGDEVLRTVAARLTSISRPSDTVARLGGDEFAVIAADLRTTADASDLAARLIEAVSEPYAVNGVPVRISASIGIAPYAPGSMDADTLLSRADLALYHAKAAGRSDHRSFTEAMDAKARSRTMLGAELGEAIDRDELFLLYQPQIDLRCGRVTGVEALARWRHPRRGVLRPDIFLPVAEQTGFIGKLGRWALSTACREAKAWVDAGRAPFRVAVDVSSLQFKTPLAFEADIEEALAESGLAPENLELELTETVLTSTLRIHANVLPRLRERGLTIAMDGFGAGYSSLDCFRRYPIDRVKIARTLVRDIEAGGADAAIVKATIGLARELGIGVVAEGVERRSQLDLLQSWGCEEAQGFYFAKPLTAERIAPLLGAGFRPSLAAMPALDLGRHPPATVQSCACHSVRAAPVS
jgi:diguanylate cyclase (GGDEF)-like protein/PAS domain S-box-containing protein